MPTHGCSLWQAMVVWLCLASIGRGQQGSCEPGAAPTDAPTITVLGIDLSGSVRLRGQAWNWFGDQMRVKYALGDAVLRLAAHQQRRKFDWRLEFEQPTLFGMPTNALLPGMYNPLGLGGAYFAANSRRRDVASAFLKQAFLRFHGFGNTGSNLRIGRLEFNDGGQVISPDPAIAFIQQDRIAGRLIGQAEWYGIGRSFDGVNLLYRLGRNTSLEFLAARPTRGVFDVNGMSELDADVQYVEVTQDLPAKRTHSQLRVFAAGYHDGRRLVKFDNRPLHLRQADTTSIRIGTFGGDYILEFGTPLGRWDIAGWGAWQLGRWGVLNHRADAVTAEGGWQPPVHFLHLWLRAAANYASGDGDPLDGKHETFIQPLPSERRYAYFPFYTFQNSQDYLGTLLLHPGRDMQIRINVHKVKLSSRADLWYQGSGPFQNATIGYTAQPSRAEGGLGNYLDAEVDAPLPKRLRLTFYAAILAAKATLTPALHGKKAGAAYTELRYSF